MDFQNNLVSLTVGFCMEKSLHTNVSINKGNQNKQRIKKLVYLLNDMNILEVGSRHQNEACGNC